MRTVIYEEAMEGIAISRIARNYEFNMPYKHTHDEYEIYYLISGERTYFIENQVYHVRPGSLVFINRNTIHMTSQSGDSYHERIVIELKEEPLASLFSCTGELSPSDFFARKQGIMELSREDQAYVLSLLDGIGRELNVRDPGYKFMALEKLARLIIFGLRNTQCSAPAPISISATHQKVTEVASYISAHCAEADSLDSVAKRFYMSKSYLSRVFKEYTGYTVNEYINVNRIQEAKKLLAGSDQSIAAVARSLGYDSVTYFEKVFRKHTETSPLKYRQQRMRENEMPPVRPQTYIGELDEAGHSQSAASPQPK